YARGLDEFVRTEKSRTVADHIRAEHDPVRGRRSKQIELRIHEVVANPSDRIARGARTEKRKHEVGAVRPAPDSQGLAEIPAMLLETKTRCHVEHAEEADRAVDDYSARVVRALSHFELKHVVDGGDDVPEIPEEVEHTDAHRVGSDFPVAFCGRPGDGAVNCIVEVEDGAIRRLQGVLWRTRGAAGERSARGHERR